MTLTLYGVTSDGTSVPIEVTDDGKLVVDTSNVSDYVKQGDDVEFGKGEFTGDIDVDGTASFAGALNVGATFDTGNGVQVFDSGSFYIRQDDSGSSNKLLTILNGGSSTANEVARINGDGSSTFLGNVSIGGSNIGWSGDTGTNIYPSQGIAIVTDTDSQGINIYKAGVSTPGASLKADGSADFAGKCGFTSAGELFFTSRGSRYKLFVSNGMVQAEEYTRQMQLNEKTEEFKSDKVQPRESDLH